MEEVRCKPLLLSRKIDRSIEMDADCKRASVVQIREGYGPDLDSLREGQRVGVLVDGEGGLHLYVDGVDQGVRARGVCCPPDLSPHLHPLQDGSPTVRYASSLLYGLFLQYVNIDFFILLKVGNC